MKSNPNQDTTSQSMRNETKTCKEKLKTETHRPISTAIIMMILLLLTTLVVGNDDG
ncbi:hypothetical protein P168DRAFT_116134 [Aspergillus campestris IBT 28561]|uniref:Uncharacterized protein n=1 Tax=Aspergillus campestris (strain IBT 28561) TaxID=1392248 RepID=A0A2I1D9R4_ASPC2|nr:uncharacterized protein P168DRAFT_116134 [Aspergillus campestris IBT 28561]PKY06615.1 hypothetical protein P168DRAFT_116134 [Aspergillus campestris IBT 28561]